MIFSAVLSVVWGIVVSGASHGILAHQSAKLIAWAAGTLVILFVRACFRAARKKAVGGSQPARSNWQPAPPARGTNRFGR
jgi:hypothetical protein